MNTVLFCLPNLFCLVAVIFVPLGYALLLGIGLLSFNANSTEGFTLTHLFQLFTPYNAALIGRTLEIGLVSSLIALCLGYPLGYALARAPKLYALWGTFFLVAPLMVSTVVRSFSWLIFLGRGGIVTKVCQNIGIDDCNLLHTKFAVLVGLTHLVLPFVVLPVMASVERVPRQLEEAAQVLGATRFQVFRSVLLPLTLPGAISGVLLAASVGSTVYVTPALLGGHRVRMIGNEIYDQVLVAYNWPIAAILTVVFTVLALIAVTFGLSMVRRGPPPVG